MQIVPKLTSVENCSIFLFVPEPWQHFSFYGSALLGIKPFSSQEGHLRQAWEEKRRGDDEVPEAKQFHEPLEGCGLAPGWRGPGSDVCDLPDDRACPGVGGGGWGVQAALATVPPLPEHLGSCQEHVHAAGPLESEAVALNFLEHCVCCVPATAIYNSFIISSACRWKGNFNPGWGLPRCCNNCSSPCIISVSSVNQGVQCLHYSVDACHAGGEHQQAQCWDLPSNSYRGSFPENRQKLICTTGLFWNVKVTSWVQKPLMNTPDRIQNMRVRLLLK